MTDEEKLQMLNIIEEDAWNSLPANLVPGDYYPDNPQHLLVIERCQRIRANLRIPVKTWPYTPKSWIHNGETLIDGP